MRRSSDGTLTRKKSVRSHSCEVIKSEHYRNGMPKNKNSIVWMYVRLIYLRPTHESLVTSCYRWLDIKTDIMVWNVYALSLSMKTAGAMNPLVDWVEMIFCQRSQISNQARFIHSFISTDFQNERTLFHHTISSTTNLVAMNRITNLITLTNI